MVENIRSSILKGDGKTKYLRDTDIECPTCKKAKLKIRSDIDNTVGLECPHCLYSEFRPSGEFPTGNLTDMKGRPIK